MRYTWEALVINELLPISLVLTGEGLPPVPPVPGRLFLSVRACGAHAGALGRVGAAQVISDGGAACVVLAQILGVDADNMMTDIIILDCMYAGAVLLAALAMSLRVTLLRKGWTT